MNTERGFRVAASHLTSEHVGAELYNFANELAAGRWGHKRVRDVQIARTIIEKFGDDHFLYEEDEPDEDAEPDFIVEPIYNSVDVSFNAHKRSLYLPNGKMIDYALYTLVSSVSQEVGVDEIPETIIEEILEDCLELGFEVGREQLEQHEIKKTQLVLYDVDEGGEINDYRIGASYSIPEGIIHNVMYRHIPGGTGWAPVYLADGSSSENKPQVVPLLTNEAIRSDMKNFDGEVNEFLTDVEIEASLEMSAPRTEHLRRVLGILSMVSSGLGRVR